MEKVVNLKKVFSIGYRRIPLDAPVEHHDIFLNVELLSYK